MARMSAPAQTFTGSNVNGSLSPMVLAISQTMNQTTVIDLPPSAVVSRGRSEPAPRARSSRGEAERRVLVAHEQRVRRHAEAPRRRPDDDVEDVAWVAAPRNDRRRYAACYGRAAARYGTAAAAAGGPSLARGAGAAD